MTRQAAPQTSLPRRMPREIRLGDTVLVRVDELTRRPLIVSDLAWSDDLDKSARRLLLSGTLCCAPDDHTRALFRGALDQPYSPSRLHGHPDRLHPLVYCASLLPGNGIGQWVALEGR